MTSSCVEEAKAGFERFLYGDEPLSGVPWARLQPGHKCRFVGWVIPLTG